MQTPHVQYGLKDGFRLKIVEKPAWAHLIERHWPAGPSGKLSTPWFHITNWLFRRTHATETVLLETPISQEEAETLNDSNFSWGWVRDTIPPPKLGCSVRVNATPHRETRGHIVAMHSTQDYDTICTIRLADGNFDVRCLTDLIDTRLASEK